MLILVYDSGPRITESKGQGGPRLLWYFVYLIYPFFLNKITLKMSNYMNFDCVAINDSRFYHLSIYKD